MTTLLRPFQPTRPRLVDPREQHELNFANHIGVGDVEMVLDSCRWQESTKLVFNNVNWDRNIGH